MLSFLWRQCKRIAVLVPGLIVVYISVGTIFPFFDRRLPVAVAIILTYVFGVYVFIPALMRGWHYFAPAKDLPLYAVTADGFASDPVNIGILGSRADLVAAMEAAGWHLARPTTVATILRTISTTILKRSYPTMPMSNLYLFGRHQDLGFEKEIVGKGRGHRHHVRFWATTLDDIQVSLAAVAELDLGRREQLLADKMLWAGAASRDVGITFAIGTLQLTHLVAPDTNGEREILIQQLTSKGVAEPVSTITLHQPYHLPNFAWSRTLHTDGQMALLRVKGK
jgi:hypothetical protein